jgi:hypothetical protein
MLRDRLTACKINMAFEYVPKLVVQVATSKSLAYLLSACMWLALALLIRAQFIAVRRLRKLCKSSDQPLSAPSEEAGKIDAEELQTTAERGRSLLSHLGLCCINVVAYVSRVPTSLINALRSAFEPLGRHLARLMALAVNIRWMISGPLNCLWQFVDSLSDAIASPGTTWSRFVTWALDVTADVIVHATSCGRVVEFERGSGDNAAAISAATYDAVVPKVRWQVALASRPPTAKPPVDSDTPKFCAGYLVFVICIVLTQSQFVQVAVCVLYCLLVHLLDTVKPTETSESSNGVDNVAAVTAANGRNTDLLRMQFETATAAAAACAEDPIIETSLADWLMHILISRMIKDLVSRRYCSVTTGAVAMLNVVRYPQTVVLVFVWFALHETATCCAVAAFLKELVSSALCKVSCRNQCQSCTCAVQMAADDSSIPCQHEIGDRGSLEDLPARQTERKSSHEKDSSWYIPPSRAGFGDSIRHRHGTDTWSLFDDKICPSAV